MKEPNSHIKYLSNQFPALTIRKPLFYNWDLSLRFDLQKEFKNPVGPADDEYFKEVYFRAETLFKACFESPSTELLIFIQKYQREGNGIEDDNYIFKQIEDFDKKKIKRDQVSNIYEPDDEENIWNRAIYQTQLQKVNAKNLVRGLCNTDFPDRKPYIEEELYFINKTRNLIFHIYDDRGLDILMRDKSELKKLYGKHKDWILEYDRSLILERLN